MEDQLNDDKFDLTAINNKTKLLNQYKKKFEAPSKQLAQMNINIMFNLGFKKLFQSQVFFF